MFIKKHNNKRDNNNKIIENFVCKYKLHTTPIKHFFRLLCKRYTSGVTKGCTNYEVADSPVMWVTRARGDVTIGPVTSSLPLPPPQPTLDQYYRARAPTNIIVCPPSNTNLYIRCILLLFNYCHHICGDSQLITLYK